MRGSELNTRQNHYTIEWSDSMPRKNDKNYEREPRFPMSTSLLETPATCRRSFSQLSARDEPDACELRSWNDHRIEGILIVSDSESNRSLCCTLRIGFCE